MTHTLGSIAEALGATAEGRLDLAITGVAEPARATESDLALAMEPKFAETLGQGKARAAVLWQGADWRALGLEGAIFAPRSRYVLAGVGRVFAPPLTLPHGIHPSAVIEPGAILGEDAWVGPFTYIAVGARIGPRARILNHVSIGADAVIGADALIHPHVHIGPRVVIGDRFICQPGAMIGGDGFSFVSPSRDAVEEARATGQISAASRTPGFARINSLGSVRIGDDVEVGANAAIDRGTISDTVIGDGTKLDDLVDIGHNVQIGRHCLLCGQSGVAGSSILGDRVVLGGKAGVADHLRIGSDVIVTGASGVSSHVPSGRVMMGNPAMKMDLSVASYKALRRLPRLLEKMESALKRVPKDDSSR
ncbi:UDP-3-O-(3-hydroxymyristoyl)glucosamine N-acyltransferase [Halovulum dunhuangense]|uniref:UDP-3-O-acylglucosamine N-acyltransferase n=1 Tax=Halovulum dunhuangense TaxID=1505036 RepID=A0A849L2T5_9RHOB|nr:UDP-3-O-(3-hydroxymyristoyl)glucosamine N-acyltransferase [Halovulum dunhuangense]NNU80550.1 UDP-3-O-(3-hydroxymyristoyl)glucosamine N-acyltransferase [Halovulum dunhuangense]